MKIASLSDIHGDLPKNLFLTEDNIDVVCICGDIFPFNIENDIIKSMSWFLMDFIPWVESLPCKKVIYTPGNHDFLFEYLMYGEHKCKKYDYEIEEKNNIKRTPSRIMAKLLGCHKGKSKFALLIDNSYEFEGIRFYGTPWCPNLTNWAFYKDSEGLTKVFSQIPNKCDVLLTHCPPKYDMLGTVLDARANNYMVDYGCLELFNAIENKNIKYIFSGHIHTGTHRVIEYKGKKMVNVSIKDEDYNLSYYPHIFEI